MWRFIEQTTAENTPGYVLTALLVCAVAATTATVLLRRGERLDGRRQGAALAGAAVVAGVGVWTTHFVAIFGYRPDAVLVFDPALTALSALVGVLLIGIPLAATSLVRRSVTRAVLGCLAGAGVGAMHYTGMGALEGCVVAYHPATAAASFAFAMVAFAGAAAVFHRRHGTVFSTGMLVLGVCALHFTGMYGTSLQIAEGVSAERGLDGAVLSGLVAVASLSLSGAAFAAHQINRKFEAARRAAADAEAKRDAVFSLALRNMSNGLIMFNADGRIMAFNDRALELLHLQPCDLDHGHTLVEMLRAVAARNDWTTDRLDQAAVDHAGWMRGNGSSRVETEVGGGRILAISCRPMPDGGAVLTYNDLTEHRAAQAELHHMAYHDALTGLPNRRSFREAAQRRLRGGETMAVLMLDLDRFKAVNDTLGHPIGDSLLVGIAERLTSVCAVDQTVFRLGGDEFIVLAVGGPREAVPDLARRLLETFAEPHHIGGHTISMGCSIGFAYSEPGEAYHELAQKGDLALYRAKELGRGRISCYEDGLREQAMQRRQMEEDLSQALSRNEFELRYQPLYALPERKLTGFEALIRWRHPKKGLVSPAEFIGVAEENGMIVKIGTWVLEEACRKLSCWPDHLHLAVNVSAVQLRAPGFADLIEATLARHGVRPSRLELELTETAMVTDAHELSLVLRAIRRCGVRIAMDDFGTGYSSLAHLRDFELDRIKIDRSFVNTESDDAGARAVIRAVTSMASDLSILTVAEGIETQEQLERLVALGCDVAQGYLLGRPLVESDANRLIGIEMFDEDARADQALMLGRTGS